MSRRLELLYLALLPLAVVAVLILKALDLTESGLAAAIVLLSLYFAAIWGFDPPEMGWNRRAGRPDPESTSK